jgi:rhodanese-related sulfurtransferase
VPEPAGEPDLVVVDTTWGEVQPWEPVAGVMTVGELELVTLVDGGALLIDSRVPDSRSGVTLPGAVSIPHDEAADRREEFDRDVMVLFCNGPQCPQTPDALRSLVAAGVDPRRLRYYRGGLHDWVILGFPTASV